MKILAKNHSAKIVNELQGPVHCVSVCPVYTLGVPGQCTMLVYAQCIHQGPVCHVSVCHCVIGVPQSKSAEFQEKKKKVSESVYSVKILKIKVEQFNLTQTVLLIMLINLNLILIISPTDPTFSKPSQNIKRPLTIIVKLPILKKKNKISNLFSFSQYQIIQKDMPMRKKELNKRYKEKQKLKRK